MIAEANGKTFEFPEGTTQEEMGSVIDEYFNQPGLLERSYDTAVQGASDALSSVMGDNVQANADPAPTSPMDRAQDAILDVGRAGGSIAADALITGGKEVLSPETQQSIERGFESALNSPPVNAIASGWNAFEQAAPELARGVAKGAEIGTMLLPKIPIGKLAKAKMGTGRPLEKAGRKVQRNYRQQKMADMILPDSAHGKEGKTVMNKWGTKSMEPNPYYESVIETMAKNKVIKPSRSASYNYNAVQNRVEELSNKLLDDINKSGNPDVDMGRLQQEFTKAQERLGQSHTLTGNALDSSNKIMEEVVRLLDKSDGSAADILSIRKELDEWLRSNKTNIFNPEIETAQGLAMREIRQVLNDAVDRSVPKAKVNRSLKEQSELLSARTILERTADGQAKTAIGRVFDKVTDAIPMSLGKSPAGAAASTVIGITALSNPLVQSLIALGAVGWGGTKALKYGSRQWKVTAGKAVQQMNKLIDKVDPVTSKALIPQREALIQLMQDARETEEAPKGMVGTVRGSSARQLGF